MKRNCNICGNCIETFEYNLKIDTKEYSHCSICQRYDKCATAKLTDEEPINIVIDIEDIYDKYMWW